MPEDMPILLKRINVMVGITRSKVILFRRFEMIMFLGAEHPTKASVLRRFPWPGFLTGWVGVAEWRLGGWTSWGFGPQDTGILLVFAHHKP